MQKKPNLLVILTDQQSCWTLGSYGGKLIETPHIDSLAAEGAKLDQFFTVSAVCTPSRGCYMTGRYPHSHGAYVNNRELGRDQITLAHILQDNGYHTAYFGKWHLDGAERPGWLTPERSMGFAECRFMFNRGHWKSILEQENGNPEVSNQIGDEKTFTTDWLTDKTIDYIGRQSQEKEPFYCFLSIPDPHTPFTVRKPYDTMYKPEDMDVPVTYWQEDLPDWVKEAGNVITDKAGFESKLKAMKAQYCGEVKCIDDNVGRILACLQQLDILDDTIVIFTSDHGEYMGEHGLLHKNHLYETAYRVPFLIRWPGQIQPGTVCERLVSNVDFQQTVLGLLNLPASGKEQGRDASPLLRKQQADWEDEVYIHHSSLERAGIFTKEFELAYTKDRDTILFDRIRDPEQQHNLFGDPSYGEIVRQLTARILEHNRKVGSPALQWLEKIGQ